jgi:1,4-dihydroxy-2-naphthoate octaprenyltransferase
MEKMKHMLIMMVSVLIVLVLVHICTKGLNVEVFALFAICVGASIFLTYGVRPICSSSCVLG